MKKEKNRSFRLSRVSLNTRLTIILGCVVFASVLVAFGIVNLIRLVNPQASNFHLLLQLNVFCLIIAMIATRLILKRFLEPIKTLREAMQKVAEGDFSTRIETKSTSAEIQDMFSGFNIMTKELASTEILQTDFVSNVSHEFKTPINAIEGYTTLLQSTENIDEVENEYIEKILFNTKRLSSLVSNILLLSKIENQSIQTKQVKFRLDEQIRETIVALEQSWTEKDIELNVELEEIEYYGSEALSYHIWSNIIGNAIKFSPDGGAVKINLTKEQNSIFFTVEDNGPGLTEEAKKHLFDKFYQADSSHKQEGNGLGLALVKRIVTILGGEVYAENLESGGCRFTVILNRN
ncbi:MAG: HAMP domain-containing histidine kinase [Ruminococcaceae bacterium]|nr:HAMP domain-containing histidine kinase [Oscillospiraceae bacterium]